MDFDSSRKIPNSAEYQRLHKWVKSQLGKANHCSVDKSHAATRYDWSNISKKYLADLSDWQQLCRACHKAYDPLTEYGKKSMASKNKINSIGNQAHAMPVLMVYPNGSWIKFPSTRKAQEATGILYTAISNVLTGRAKTAGGYQWQRIGG